MSSVNIIEIKSFNRTLFFIVFLLSPQTVHTAGFMAGAYDTGIDSTWSAARYESSGFCGKLVSIGLGGYAGTNISQESETGPGQDDKYESGHNTRCSGTIDFESKEMFISLGYAFFPCGDKSGGGYFGGSLTGYGANSKVRSSRQKDIRKIEESCLTGFCNLFTGYSAGFDEQYLFDMRLGYSRMIDEKSDVSGNSSRDAANRFSRSGQIYAQVNFVKAF